MKVLKRLGFLSVPILAVGLALGFGGADNASALSVKIEDNPNSPQYIRITRRVENVTTKVVNKFTYTVTQDSSNPGVIGGLPESFDIDFSTVPNDNMVAEENYELNLGSAVFPEMGDYKIMVRETATGDAANYPVDAAHEYYIYVSVRNKVDTYNRPTGEYVAMLAVNVKDHDAGDKVAAIFNKSAERTYINITKEVTGNLGNTEEYFKFKLNIEGLNNGDYFSVTGQDAVVTYKGETITTSNTVVVGQDNYVYLKHGQSVFIGKVGENGQLPIGTKISVEELGAEDYTKYVDGEQGSVSRMKAAGKIAIENTYHFRNSKLSNVLTGIALNVAPFIVAGMMIGGLAFAAILVKKKKTKR